MTRGGFLKSLLALAGVPAVLKVAKPPKTTLNGLLNSFYPEMGQYWAGLPARMRFPKMPLPYAKFL